MYARPFLLLLPGSIECLSVFSVFSPHELDEERAKMPMEVKGKRLTLDLEPAFQRRLKAISALKGISMRGYCQAAIDRKLTEARARSPRGEARPR